MYRNIIFIFFVVLLYSCNSPNHPHSHDHEGHSHDHDSMHIKEEARPDILELGKFVDAEQAVPAVELINLMDGKDELEITISGNVVACCQHSGCWMDVELGDDVMNVTFLDGDFIVSSYSVEKNAIMKGTAYKELVPAERLRAYAKDEGKSQEEIDAITDDAYEYTFVAEGVILK